LLRLGGEARWKHLKANLGELGWGPTTLKQTLDQMVKEGSIRKEARLGTKGAEVWYMVQIKDYDIWKPFMKAKEEGEAPSLQDIAERIREKAQQLDGKEKEIFLKHQLHRIVFDYGLLAHGALLFMCLWGVENGKLEESTSLTIYDYIVDVIMKRMDKELLRFLFEYRKYALEVIDQMLREPIEFPSVPPRPLEQ